MSSVVDNGWEKREKQLCRLVDVGTVVVVVSSELQMGLFLPFLPFSVVVVVDVVDVVLQPTTPPPLFYIFFFFFFLFWLVSTLVFFFLLLFSAASFLIVFELLKPGRTQYHHLSRRIPSNSQGLSYRTRDVRSSFWLFILSPPPPKP